MMDDKCRNESVPRSDIADDLRQASVVMRNEIRKFASSKKLLLFGAVMSFMAILVTAIVFIYGNDMISNHPGTPKSFVIGIYEAVITLVIIVGGVLFSATSIVSEFEERTALILFTHSIRKRSIFLGKYTASALITLMFVIAYYAIAMIATLIFAGELPSETLGSIAGSLCFVFAITGLSFLLSSVAKKGSTASIMTLVMYLLVLNVIGSLLQQFNICDTWWILNQASDAITSSANLERNLLTLIVWGIATVIPAYSIFKRRDF